MSESQFVPARLHYYPGWQEPGPVLECIVNQQAFESLPEDLQEIVRLACSATNDQMTAEFVARNAQSLQQLRAEGEVQILPFPDEVLLALQRISIEVIDEVVARDEKAARIYASFSSFRDSVSDWTNISERAMLRIRPD